MLACVRLMFVVRVNWRRASHSAEYRTNGIPGRSHTHTFFLTLNVPIDSTPYIYAHR